MPDQSFCLDRAISTNRERSAINRKTCDPSAGRSNSRAFDASHQNSRLQAALNFNQLFTAECANARSRAPLSTASVTGPASINISRSPSLAEATCRISTIKATHYLAFCKCAKGLANSKSPIFKGALCLYGSDIQYMYCLNSNIDVVGGSH